MTFFNRKCSLPLPFVPSSFQNNNLTIRWWRRLALRSVTQKNDKAKKKLLIKLTNWYFCSVFTFSIQISFACSNIVGYKKFFAFLLSIFTAYLSTIYIFFVNEFNDSKTTSHMCILFSAFGHSIKNILW